MTSRRSLSVALASVVAAAVLASCTATPVTGPAGGGAGAAPVVADSVVERSVRLRVDPKAGTIQALTSPALLAVIEHDMALDFDVVNLTNASGQTRFTLLATNRGDGLTALSFRTSGARTMTAPAQPVTLGDLAPAQQASVQLTFDNAAGTAFDVTLYLQATLIAKGSQGTAAGATAAPSATPTAAPTSAPTATPAPTSAPTATPAPTAAPTNAPTSGPSANPTTPPPAIGDPGPGAARGRILMNGKPSYNPISLQLIKNPGWVVRNVTTDAQGYFGATGLEAGTYLAYFYNDSNRERIGYWRSRDHVVDGTKGAAFPTVDFYQKGLLNTPAMDARRSFPVEFSWLPQTQTVDHYRLRVHSTGGRTFTLIHQSNRIPGTATSTSWDGSGAATPISSTNRYFWGLYWDAGLVGEGGNLYQAIYFNP